MMDSGQLIMALMVVLCVLAALDLWRQIAIKSQEQLIQQYKDALKHSYDFWRIGYRLEEVDEQVEVEASRLVSLSASVDSIVRERNKDKSLRSHGKSESVEHIRRSLVLAHSMIRNSSSVFHIRCEEQGNLFRIGSTDYRTDPRDVCQLFVSADPLTDGPQTMFDLIPLDSGAVALRSVANNMFVKAVPPPPDNTEAPWKLVIGGSIPGAAGAFRITSEGYLYSALVGGFFTCSRGQMIAGQEGKYGNWNKFVLEKVSEEQLQHAYGLVAMSEEVIKIQTNYIKEKQISVEERKKKIHETISADSTQTVKICMGVPITSKGTEMAEVVDSPFWSNLFDSFMKSVDWRSNRYIFRFYLGFDKADPLYDTGDAWSDMREEFKHRAIFRMTEQQMDEVAINNVLENFLSLKLMHFDHLEGSPSQVVSQLMLAGYRDNFDYFYQVNDDTSITTPNWAPKLVATLAGNPSIPNFGVTGPVDSNNDKIFTHSFTHRTHFDIFGHLFPPYFKNWWSDDWITTVYGSEHTFRNEDVSISHNVKAQKVSGFTRYTVDQSAQLHLDEELRKGHAQIDEWLKKQGLPRLTLPNVCGYVPAIGYLYNSLGTSTKAKVIEPIKS